MYGKLADEYCSSITSSGRRNNLYDLYTYLGCTTPFTVLATLQEIWPDNNRTFLMSAAKGGSVSLCQEMLQHTNTGINTSNSKGYTALHFACFHGHADVAILLLNRGADMYIRNHYRETAIEAAQAAGFHEVCQTLWSHYFTPLVNNPHRLDALLTPDVALVEGITTAVPRKSDNISQNNNCSYLHRQHIYQWHEVTAESYNNEMIQLKDSFQTQVEVTDTTIVDMTPPEHSKTHILTVSALSNCFLEVVDCESGCTNVPPGLTFEFNELLQKIEDVGQLRFIIGRSSSSAICLSDMSISKAHATLVFLEGVGLCVSDSSKHGTVVNDVKVYNQTSSANVLCKHEILKSVDDTLSVGRVHMVLKKKKKKSNATLSQGFQPNQNLGKQLVGAMKQQQMFESRQLKAQSASLDLLGQRQTEENISSRVLKKRQELESSSEAKTNSETERVSGSQKRVRPDKDQLSSSSSSSSFLSEDFNSSSFIGRSMLANLGWKEGSALGKTQGSHQSSGGSEGQGTSTSLRLPQRVIEVVQKTGTSGLGSKEESGDAGGRDKKLRHGHDSTSQGGGRADPWEKAQSRYNKICKENAKR